jgi:hypothetical protein
MSVKDCKLLQFPKVDERRGNLTFVEQRKHVPFDIKRVFYVYDIPAGESRAGHAHRTLEEVVICLSGSLVASLDDGTKKKKFTLNRPWNGFYVAPMIWLTLGEFDPGTVYAVLCSELYDEKDYIRDYDAFLKATRA